MNVICLFCRQIMDSSSSESDGISSDVREGGGTKKRRRHVKRSNYLQGKCIS